MEPIHRIPTHPPPLRPPPISRHIVQNYQRVPHRVRCTSESNKVGSDIPITLFALNSRLVGNQLVSRYKQLMMYLYLFKIGSIYIDSGTGASQTLNGASPCIARNLYDFMKSLESLQRQKTLWYPYVPSHSPTHLKTPLIIT